MSEITQTDAEMARNEPVEVFSVVDGGKRIDYKIRALPIARAEAWMEKANAVEELHAAVVDAQKGSDRTALAEARAEYSDAVYKCVFSYDPEAIPESLGEVITPAQMARAFAVMQMVNDPFVSAGIVQLNIQKQAMKGLPMKLIEKQLAGNGVTRDS